MCTSIVVNKKKTLVGFNLDILDMEYRISESNDAVTIDINDPVEGWMPLFGVTNEGNFVGMPTCWPTDEASNPSDEEDINIINLDIDVLTKKKSFLEIKEIVESKRICSIPHMTFMSSVSNKNGDVLHIIPGQGYKYYEKPEYIVLTNFSPFKIDKELHPWMGLDRYNLANELLNKTDDNFDVSDLFEVLNKVSQIICPTVVSMVYDANDNKVYWCLDRKYNDMKQRVF